MDNMADGWDLPQEDEFALVASGLSFMLGTVVFAPSDRRYKSYHKLRAAAPHEVARWKAALLRFLQKLVRLARFQREITFARFRRRILLRQQTVFDPFFKLRERNFSERLRRRAERGERAFGVGFGNFGSKA